MKNTAKVAVDFDVDEEEVVITVDLADVSVSHRLRPLDGWLLLYLLDPSFTNDSNAVSFCEMALATEPPVGIMEMYDALLMSLPAGHIVVPLSMVTSFRVELLKVLKNYADDLRLDS
jgi:hypothetical protein